MQRFIHPTYIDGWQDSLTGRIVSAIDIVNGVQLFRFDLKIPRRRLQRKLAHHVRPLPRPWKVAR